MSDSKENAQDLYECSKGVIGRNSVVYITQT